MDIVTATRLYEDWLRKQTTVVEPDLIQKHANMAHDPFLFMRATCYRRAARWPIVCAELRDAPIVNSVRDLHIENFGTWRDSEGRLVWGVNDFDEAYPGPYTEDLTTLAASVKVAYTFGMLSFRPKDACEAILTGYEKGLRKGPSPFVLSHRHTKLRRMAESELRGPKSFWQKMLLLPEAAQMPDSARTVLNASLPSTCHVQYKTRRAGQGSLGHQRFVAISDCFGGYIAREVKALTPSAAAWALGLDTGKLFYEQVVDQSARSVDPFLAIRENWIVRRLSPHCSRIELGQLKAARDGAVLLKAMGREVANIHAADPTVAEQVLDDLSGRGKNWLRDASGEMAEDVIADWKVWRREFEKAA
jgi:hypothetical protein